MYEKSPDANVEAIRQSLLERSVHGLRKYGVTTERTDLTVAQWLRHAQEEALDQAVYLERCIKDALALEALVDAVLRLPDLYFEDPGMNSIPSYRLITLIQNARKAAKNIRHK